MRERRNGDIEEFIKKNYIVCSCGYRNKIENVNKYGTCLYCKKVLDEKVFFLKKLRQELKNENRKGGISK